MRSSYPKPSYLSNKQPPGTANRDLYLRLKFMTITIYKIMKNFSTVVFAFIFSLLLVTDASATMRIFTGTGNFGTAARWDGGTMPTANDTLIINGICTVENNAATDNVAYAGVAIGYLGTGTLNWAVGGTNRLRVVNGLGSVSGGTLDMTNGGHIIVGRQFLSANLTFIPGTGTIEITSPLTIPAGYATYYNLVINLTSGSVDLTANTTITNDLVISNGQFNVPNFNLTVNNRTVINDSMYITSTTGTKTFADIIISSTGRLINSANEPLTINESLTNNGIYTVGTGSVTFTGASADTISGSSTTAFGTGGIVINKGVSSANVLDVQSVITMAGTLTLTNGTFKLSSASTITPFPANIAVAPYLIPSTAGLWNNGGTINSPAMSWTIAGVLRASAGTLTIGTASDNALIPRSTSTITIDGGTVNLASRISNPATAWTFVMSSGTMTLNTVGSTAASIAPFNMDIVGCSFGMSGGTMIIQRSGNTSAGYSNLSTGGAGFTGGTLQIGNASTPAANTMRITSTRAVYNLSVNSSNATAQLLTSALVVTNNVEISAGTLNVNNLNLSVGGNFENNGTFTAGSARVTFNGSGVDTLSGSSTTAFNLVTLNKGTTSADVLDVQSVITIPANSFTLTNGTFKVTGASTLSLFSADVAAAPYLIPSTAGIWCNGGTINSAAMNWTVAGLLRVSNGTFNVGTASNNVLIPRSTSTIMVDGGVLKLASRISNPGTAWTFNMSGGTMYIDSVGSTTASPFNMDAAACSFSMSGGTMIIVRAGTGSAGFNNLANSGSGFTGGTLQIGNATTPAASVMRITSTNPVYNLTVNSANAEAELLTSALEVSNDVTLTAGTLDLNNLNISIGGDLTKASAATFTPGSATVTFDGAGAQAITGTSATQTFNHVIVAKSSGTTLSTGGSTTTMTVNNLTLTSGNFTAPATLNINAASGSSLVMTAGTFTAGANINITGSWTKSIASVFTHSNGTVTFTGTGAQAINGAALSQTFYNLVLSKTAGTALTVGGSTATLHITNNLTQTTGNFTPPATLNLTGTLTLSAGTFTAGNNVSVGGDFTKASGATFTQGSGTVTFNGSGTQSINGTSASQTFNHVVVNKTAATLLQTGGSTTSLTAGNFTLTAGDFNAPATMNINGNLLLSSGTYTAATVTNLLGHWTKNSGSSFTHNSATVNMNGSSAQNITGSSSTTFHNLVIGNALNVVLGASITINNNIDLSSGSVLLTTNNLTIGSSASISNYSSANYIMTNDDPASGGFLIQNVGTSPVIFPVGASASYTPATIINDGTTDNFRVRVFTGVYANGTSGGLHQDLTHSVNKTWLVEEVNSGGSDVTLELQWNTSDQNINFASNNCGMFHYTGGLWDIPASFGPCNTVSSDVYSGTMSGITSFSPFTMGDRNVPLPVELLAFSATKVSKDVVLSWTTATESNNSHFAIERSVDGESFTAIDSLAGAGNSNNILDYNYTDKQAVQSAVSYYRLRQVDFDGSFSYSQVVSVQGTANMTIGNIYPMPAMENINVPVEALRGGSCKADIYDLSGKLVHTETFSLGSASQTLSISTAALPQGMYVLSINNSNGENHSMKLIK
jgi:hypothetical protein